MAQSTIRSISEQMDTIGAVKEQLARLEAALRGAGNGTLTLDRPERQSHEQLLTAVARLVRSEPYVTVRLVQERLAVGTRTATRLIHEAARGGLGVLMYQQAESGPMMRLELISPDRVLIDKQPRSR